MNLIDVNTAFPTDDKCRELLARLRWPEGPRCPRCKADAVELDTDKQLFYCKDCDYQFSTTTGTIFNDTHLPLVKWFAATLLLCEAKKGMSACQIQRTLGIGSYKTAWYLCHRIRAAMAELDKPMMDGTVEIDETYVGGKARRWLPRRDKEVVFGIRQRNGELRFIHASEANSKTVRQIVSENLSEDVEVIVTDESSIYPFGFGKKHRNAHKTINHSREYVSGLVHTNTVESAFSLLKRGIMGTWHNISAKHLPAYLNEMTFRFNRRANSDLFVDTLRHMVTAPVLTFKKLTKETEAA
ncbi:MAG: IS1595 family transposase [Candidatus Acidiferrales bacterium]